MKILHTSADIIAEWEETQCNNTLQPNDYCGSSEDVQVCRLVRLYQCHSSGESQGHGEGDDYHQRSHFLQGFGRCSHDNPKEVMISISIACLSLNIWLWRFT